MNHQLSLDMEHFCRQVGLYVRINSLARKTRKLTRKLSGNRGTLTATVSPTGRIIIDLVMTNDHFYARFDGKQELVYGGGTTLCLPGMITQHHTDETVMYRLRTEIEQHFRGFQRLDGLPLTGEFSRYRLVGGHLKMYYA